MAENLVTDSKTFGIVIDRELISPQSTVNIFRLSPGKIVLDYDEEQRIVSPIQIGHYAWSIDAKVKNDLKYTPFARYYIVHIYVNVQPALDINQSAVLEVLRPYGHTRTNSYTIKSSQNLRQKYGPYELALSVQKFPSYLPTTPIQMTLKLINGNGKEPNRLRTFTEKNIVLDSLNNFLEYSRELLQKHEFSDVTIKIRGRELPAHKIMLCSSSSVFKAMFNSNFRESWDNTIEIEDFEFEVISEMLEFIYTHKTPQFRSTGGDVDTLSLYKASHKYDIEYLLKLCRKELLLTFNIESALDVLLLADTYDDAFLKKAILDFICKNPPALDDVPKYERIVQQQPGLLKDILNCKFQQK